MSSSQASLAVENVKKDKNWSVRQVFTRRLVRHFFTNYPKHLYLLIAFSVIVASCVRMKFLLSIDEQDPTCEQIMPVFQIQDWYELFD